MALSRGVKIGLAVAGGILALLLLVLIGWLILRKPSPNPNPSPSPTPVPVNPLPITLPTGSSLVSSSANDTIFDSTGNYRLTVQDDGDIVLYDNVSGNKVWESQAISNPSPPYTLTNQADGNLVLYNSAGTAQWASNTADNIPKTLRFYTDSKGNTRAGLLNNTGDMYSWVSGSSLNVGESLSSISFMNSLSDPTGRYVFLLQTDGNIVLYDSTQNSNIWTSGQPSPNNPPYTLVLQSSDGNLVLYDNSGMARWSPNLSPSNANRMLQFYIDGSGNVHMGLFNVGNNTPIWNT